VATADDVKGAGMRISDLSRASAVPIPTIKYYLREGLLHDGRRTSATQARYDDTHLRRLAVVRALLGPAGLSVARTRDLLRQLDEPPERLHDLLGHAHGATVRDLPEDLDTGPACALLERWGWPVESCAPHGVRALAAALDGLATAGLELPAAVLDTYGRAARDIGRADVAGVPTDSLEAAVRHVVLGTVLAEPLLLALRRLAQEVASQERFGTAGVPDAGHPAES
jgi:DNA-binding transcriptional MerR regulator